MSRTEIVSSTPLTNPTESDLRAALALDESQTGKAGKAGTNCAELFVDTQDGNEEASEGLGELLAWNRYIYKRDQQGHLVLENDLLVVTGTERVEKPLSAAFLAAYKSGDLMELGRIVKRTMDDAYLAAAADAIYDLPDEETCDEDEQADIAFRIARDRAMEDAA